MRRLLPALDEFASIVFEGFAIGLVLEVLLNLIFLTCCAIIPVGGNWIADGWLTQLPWVPRLFQDAKSELAERPLRAFP